MATHTHIELGRKTKNMADNNLERNREATQKYHLRNF
jgi:hypothetical protein